MSKTHRKVITRHVWEEYMEICEDIRHTIGNKEIYELREETVERVFGTAKLFFIISGILEKFMAKGKPGLEMAF